MMRRNVMAYLRNCGYNAAVCKTKWESSGGLAAGNYEFIDVLRKEYSTRYFVDLDFASEFEIARPTNSYERLLQHVPRVFIGTSEDLKQILKLVSDSARRSLKSRGLHLPPWRKNRFHAEQVARSVPPNGEPISCVVFFSFDGEARLRSQMPRRRFRRRRQRRAVTVSRDSPYKMTGIDIIIKKNKK
ncbi:UNVERIFIED_CONTAM: hypothetical protein Sradi_0377600 [Sesamum radiatum]|uniref:Uncharacterized protein n=1 Tax=Sesamum radiatum TaxID=300843 RepID=A0AAW2W910_SESRA